MRPTCATLMLCVSLLWAFPSFGFSQRDLAEARARFLDKVIADNPERETAIRKYLAGYVGEGRRKMHILDSLGIFSHNAARKDIVIERIRFMDGDGGFCLFLVMKDEKDGQAYTLFLEYGVSSGLRCILRDIYFSIVFEEGLQEVKQFFESR